MNELALFAGAGGGILGGKLMGWRTICAVERDAYCASVLAQRQNDGILEAFPIWSDVSNFDGRPWRGIVEIVSGGFPCQDISAAGSGSGIEGERSGLWKQMSRIVGEVRPKFVLVENSPILTSRGFGTVCGDMAEMGYDCRWGVISAADAIWLGGTPCMDHLRERIWIVCADTQQEGLERFRANARESKDSQFGSLCASASNRKRSGRKWQGQTESEEWNGDFEFIGRMQEVADTCEGRQIESEEGEIKFTRGAQVERASSEDADSDKSRSSRRAGNKPKQTGRGEFENGGWWATEPELDRVVSGMAHRVDRIGAIGNGQVSRVVKLAWEILGPK